MKALWPCLLVLLLVGCDDSRRSSAPVANSDGKSNTTTPATTEPSLNAPAKTDATKTADPTNTAINTRDRNSAEKTSLDQNENQKDIDITAGIRKRVVAEKMSVEAHNVKIITQDGKVTLRGPVATDEEKQKIEEIARDVAGPDMVDSMLEISGK